MVPGHAGDARFTGPEFQEPLRFIETNQGVANFSWTGPEAATFELQQSPDPAFPESETRTRYQGNDPGSVISGLPAGSHHFRIRAIAHDGIPGEWSTPVEVRVEFMATRWVVTLLVFGGVVFFATLAAIITGHLRTRQSHAEP